MAPVPPNTTGRLRLTYTGPRGTHKMLFHAVSGFTRDATVTGARQVVFQMAGVQYAGTTWTDAEWSAPGTNFFVPFDFLDIAAPAENPTPTDADPSAKFLSFVGRSETTGVRKRLFLFNAAYTFQADLRREGPESAAIDSILDALNTNVNNIAAIDGTRVTFKDYANQGLHDYWVRQDRKL